VEDGVETDDTDGNVAKVGHGTEKGRPETAEPGRAAKPRI
jgi:hypothetical protein